MTPLRPSNPALASWVFSRDAISVSDPSASLFLMERAVVQQDNSYSPDLKVSLGPCDVTYSSILRFWV